MRGPRALPANSLTTPPVAPLLAHLFAEADAQPPLAAFGDVPPAELDRLPRSTTGYRDLPAAIDLVLLDGAKALYPDVLALLEPRLLLGAVIVADNADHSPEDLSRVRDPASGYLSLPFGADVELSVRLARRHAKTTLSINAINAIALFV
jgi:predicted O-methyltransferase YrrM